jgi:Undecaprenyl-phosphate galactose phosphotransferase WbaP
MRNLEDVYMSNVSVLPWVNSLASDDVLPRPSPLLTGMLFLLSDTFSLLASPLVAYMLWTQSNPKVPSFVNLWPALVFFWAIYWFQDLYPGMGMTPVEELKRVITGTSLVYLVLAAGIFLTKESSAYSRGIFVFSGLLSVVLVPFSRSCICHLFSSQSWWGTPVVILGAGQTAHRVIRELQAKRVIGYKPVACLDDAKSGNCQGIPIVGPLSLAPTLARTFGIRHAMLAMAHVRRETMLPLLEKCSEVFPHVFLIPNLFGIATLWVSARDLNGVLGLEVRCNLLVPFNRWVKRVMDIAVAGIALVLVAPLIAICVLCIKVVSPGRSLYFQEREGLGTRTIKIPKLRTMYPEADKLLESYLRHNPFAKSEWNKYCKLKNDPRILPIVGRFLRRTSLDELPQLWKVLKGEMSLVGPRPFPGYHTSRFDREFRKLRRKVLPGLTGLWQISARSNGDIEVQKEMDTYYIRNWSLWLDIYILSRTLRAVISGNGAY